MKWSPTLIFNAECHSRNLKKKVRFIQDEKTFRFMRTILHTLPENQSKLFEEKLDFESNTFQKFSPLFTISTDCKEITGGTNLANRLFRPTPRKWKTQIEFPWIIEENSRSECGWSMSDALVCVCLYAQVFHIYHAHRHSQSMRVYSRPIRSFSIGLSIWLS